MGVKFIGQFLLERGAITREQLLLATELQERRNRPLGAYAVERGYLTPAQAEQINREQQVTDRRFGELALTMGLLNDAQINDVLTLQKQGRIRIGEALVAAGALDAAGFEEHFAAFQADQAIYQTGTVELPEGTPCADLVRVCIDLSEKLLLRVAGLTPKRGVALLPADLAAPELLTISIGFSGSATVQFAFSASKDVAVAIARRVLGPAMALSDELVVDALKEFCNVVCGNICGKLSQPENPLEIGPPEDGLPEKRVDQKSLLVPLHLPDGRFELRFLFA
jgi:CheY-specific phosphatase CheX